MMGKVMEYANRRTLERAAGLLLIAGFVGLAWKMIDVQRTTDARAPVPEEWDDLRDQVRGQLRDGDVIRIVPFWDNLGRTVFQGTVADTKDWPFRALDWRQPEDPVVWMRFTRLVQVGRKDWVRRDETVLPTGSSTPVVMGETEHLLAQVVELPRSPLKWSALDHDRDAIVRRVGKDGAIDSCKWKRDHHDCRGLSPKEKGKKFVHVRRTVMDVGDAPRECFYVEPTPSGARVEVRFPRVPMAPGDTLLLRAGNSIQGARKAVGGRLRIELSIDGTKVVEDSYHRNDYLWIPWAITLPGKESAAERTNYDVVFSISTDRSGWRQECFDLQVLGPGWEDWGEVGYGHPHAGASGVVAVRKRDFRP